jgi:hypothetical protein
MKRNNYKYGIVFVGMKTKRGQLAIFVIVALVIIGVILVLLLYPGRGPIIPRPTEISPESYLRDCIKPELTPAINVLSKQGGYLNPEGYLQYQGEKIKYLCYTAEYYVPCVVQQPMIKEHFESELKSILNPKMQECLQNLIKEYKKRGYSASVSGSETNITIMPKKIVIDFIAPITITKDTTHTFRDFKIEINSEMYGLLLIADNIVEYEAVFGDSEITNYVSYYPDLTPKKFVLSDGSKIYTLTNIITNESFRFATRGLTFAPGGA